MRAYLVRHAETIANKTRRHHHDDDELSGNGIEQAAKLARGLRKLVYDRDVIIICAGTKRAIQTTEIVCKELQLQYSSTHLLNEVARPSILHGKDLEDPQAIEVKAQINAKGGDPQFRHSDEETFADARERVNQLFERFLVEDHQQNFIFVTHAVFMKTIVARALYGKDYTLEEYNLIYENFATSDNAAVSQIAFDADKWLLTYWNNFSHLIET